MKPIQMNESDKFCIKGDIPYIQVSPTTDPDEQVPRKEKPCSKITADSIPNNQVTGGCLPDSGQRREFTTGSVRDIRTGKGRYDLISPFALKRLAIRLEDGMTKYGERNWEKGQPLMSYLDSAIRHINIYIEDCLLGRVSIEDHMGAAFWNIHAFIHTQEMINRGYLAPELDDLPAPSNPFIEPAKNRHGRN